MCCSPPRYFTLIHLTYRYCTTYQHKCISRTSLNINDSSARSTILIEITTGSVTHISHPRANKIISFECSCGSEKCPLLTMSEYCNQGCCSCRWTGKSLGMPCSLILTDINEPHFQFNWLYLIVSKQMLL